jgi:hypothetical protein
MSGPSISYSPPLPAADRRKLEKKIEKKNEELGFVGNAHLAWLKSSDMRRRAAFSRVRPNENYSSLRDPFFWPYRTPFSARTAPIRFFQTYPRARRVRAYPNGRGLDRAERACQTSSHTAATVDPHAVKSPWLGWRVIFR